MKKQNKPTSNSKAKGKSTPEIVKGGKVTIGKDVEVVTIEESHERLQLKEIRVCPLNYRKSFDERELNELAESIRKKGVLQDILVRPIHDEVFTHEVVCGERRFRAAHIAGITEIPVKVRHLTDAEVMEIMFIENLHRVNPHPLHEAFGFAQMVSIKKKVEQIAQSVGKTAVYVYQRLKLTNMVSLAQDIFLAGKMNIQQALELAMVPDSSQLDFIEDNCSNWQDDNFVFPSGRYLFDRYRNDLKRAPFDTKDKMLIPEKGACTKCPFNSATMTTLFPEEAKTSICMNKECFAQKCDASLMAKVMNQLNGFEDKPVAIIKSYSSNDRLIKLALSIPSLEGLPVVSYNEVDFIQEPEMPTEEEYEDYGDEAPEEFSHALIDYKAEMGDYKMKIEGGNWKWGLYLDGSEVRLERYTDFQNRYGRQNTASVTAKAVQEAIKSGTVTKAMLLGEIERLDTLERKNKENDAIKVHSEIYRSFAEHAGLSSCSFPLTHADRSAIPFLIYRSLSYRINDEFWKAIDIEEPEEHEDVYSFFSSITDDQVAVLVRIALADRLETKQRESREGYFLRKVAAEINIDLDAIKAVQDKEAEKRQVSVNTRRQAALLRADSLPEEDTSEIMKTPIEDSPDDEVEEYEPIDMEESAD